MKEHNMMKSKKFGGSELETCGPFYHTGNLRLKKKSLLVLRKGKHLFSIYLCIFFFFFFFFNLFRLYI